MVQSAVVPPTTTAVDLKHWLEQVEAKPTIVVNLFLNGKAWQSNIRGPYFRL